MDLELLLELSAVQGKIVESLLPENQIASIEDVMPI